MIVMNKPSVLQITPDVFWTGVQDPDLVTFDVVMETRYGTTYNAYLIKAGKTAMIETVKAPFWEEYRQKLEQLTDPAGIAYVIMNHTEPDHSGSLPELLKIAPKATVVGSGNAIRYLSDQMGSDFPHLIVKDGDTLDLGGKTLRFIGAPNLHWPDSMYTYLQEDKLLFSCDSFGCHYSHPAMFDDLVGEFDDAFLYYYNVIMKPYSKFMLKAIQKIRPLEMFAVCPGHGPILRKNWRKYVDWSEQLASEAVRYPLPNRIMIAYVSAYRNTALMAKKIAEGIQAASPGLEADLCDLEGMSPETVEKHVTEASGIIAGSPIINQNILLHLYQLFAIMNPIRDRGKPAAAFGSFGWSADFMKMLETNLLNLRLKLIGEGVYVRFTPHAEDLDRCFALGKKMGEEILAADAKCSD